MKSKIFPWCMALWLMLNSSCAAANPSLHNIITDIQKNLDRPPVSMEVETITYGLDPNGIQPPRVLQMEKVNFRKDGRQVDITTDRFAPNEEGKFVSDDFATRHFCNNEYAFFSQKSHGYQTFTFQSAEGIQKGSLFNLSNGNVLDGYFNHNNSDGHWTEIFRKESDNVVIADARETIDGHPCIVVKADLTCGVYMLWLDPQQKFTLRKAHVLLDANDRVWGKPLKDSFIPFKCYGPPAGRHFQTMEVALDNIKTEIIEGFTVPVEGTYTTHCTFDDGQRSATQYEIRRSNIQWNPDLKTLKAFEINVPEGTIFQENLENGNYKKYIWSQGKMVHQNKTESGFSN